MRYAYIRASVVVHIAGVDSEPMDGAQVVEIPDGAAIENGYLYNGATFSAPTLARPTVISVPEFLLRFFVDEGAAIRAARPTNGKINHYMTILEHPEVKVVHLNIAPTIEAVTYIINAIKTTVSYTQAQADTRIAQILS